MKKIIKTSLLSLILSCMLSSCYYYASYDASYTITGQVTNASHEPVEIPLNIGAYLCLSAKNLGYILCENFSSDSHGKFAVSGHAMSNGIPVDSDNEKILLEDPVFSLHIPRGAPSEYSPSALSSYASKMLNPPTYYYIPVTTLSFSEIGNSALVSTQIIVNYLFSKNGTVIAPPKTSNNTKIINNNVNVNINN